MGESFTSVAKINHPKVEGALVRQRLFELIDNSRQKNIIWASAPGGSGKTTLISSYLGARNIPCLWYQVDERDEDIASFFYYMGLAVEAVTGRKQQMPLLTPEYLAGITTFARRFFEELYSHIPRPFALVFDNYQQASPYALLHEVIKEACLLLPEGVKIFFISRHEPAPALATSDFIEKTRFLTWNDIRFSLDEFREMVRMQDWDSLEDKTLLRLYARTEGWAAGLLIMMESLKKNGSVHSEIKSFGAEDIFGYFAGELFRSIMDRETRVFLMRSSVLPDMSVSVAEKLTGIKNAEQILSKLHRDHFFTGRYGDASPVYQYHPLFREFLLFRMNETYSSEDVISLRRKAAFLMEESSRIEDAAQLFIEASDWLNLTGLILRSAKTMTDQGRNRTLLGWIDALPHEMLDDKPWLWYWKGVSLMPFNAAESQRYFEKAFEIFRVHDDRAGIFLSWSGIADINIWVGEFCHLVDWIEKLDEVLKNDNTFPSPAIEKHVTLSIFNALAFKQPHHPDISLWADRVFNLLHQKGRADNDLLLSSFYLGFYYLWMGNFAKATLVVDLLDRVAGHPKVTEIINISIKTLGATYALFVTKPEFCLENMNAGLQMAEKSGIHVWNNHLYLHGMTAAIALGDPKLYQELEQKLDLREARRFDIAFYNVLKAWQAYRQGENEYAVMKQKIAHDTLDSVGFMLAMPLAEIIKAEILFAAGEKEKAAWYVSSALELGRRMNSILHEYWCLLFQAYMALDSGLKEDALDFLRGALALGKKHSFETVSIWTPSFLTQLCVQALDHDIEVDYVQRLIRERNLVPDAQALTSERWPFPLKIYTLGNFVAQKEGVNIGSQGKSHFKLMSILKALIALGSRQVNGHSISDLLWPEAEGDAADSTLGSSLHRLRKLLGSDDFIVVQDGKITLNPAHCWVDTLAFEQLALKMEGLFRKGSSIPVDELAALNNELFRLYRGAFLADNDEPWAVPMREKLRGRFTRLVIACGRAWESMEDWDKAGDCYQRGVDTEPCSEELFRCIISCNLRRGFPTEAVRSYYLCRDYLLTHLGMAPSHETRALIREHLPQNK